MPVQRGPLLLRMDQAARADAGCVRRSYGRSDLDQMLEDIRRAGIKARSDATTTAIAQLVSCLQSTAARYLTHVADPRKAMFMTMERIERRAATGKADEAKLVLFEQQLRAHGLLGEEEDIFSDLQMTLDSLTRNWLTLC